MRIQNVLPRDAIPSIDDPQFGDEYIGDPGDEVIVVDADPPRAYPIRILSYHEVVNDVVDGGSLACDPESRVDADDVADGRCIAVTWCPICWSGVVYDRAVGGRPLTFGVSGTLVDDALVMYDRETESEWRQTTGTALTGEFAGTRLEILPSTTVTWERFAGDHPDGIVLQPVHGTDAGAGFSPRESYDMEPYERYAGSAEFGLYGMRREGKRRSWDRDDLDAKTLVLGITHQGEAIGYPTSRVEAAGGIVTDTVGGRDIVVFATDNGIHAYEDPGFEFETQDGTIYAAGSKWDGVTGESTDGRRLERVPGRRLFAFAWQDAHGRDAFFPRS